MCLYGDCLCIAVGDDYAADLARRAVRAQGCHAFPDLLHDECVGVLGFLEQFHE